MTITATNVSLPQFVSFNLGIDQDLLNCENNYHYKPTGSKQPAPSGGKPVAQEPDTLSTATTDLLQPPK